MSSKDTIKRCFVVSLLLIINSVLTSSPIGLLVLFPQYLFVLFLVNKRNYDKAVLWHFLFMITSYCRLDFVTSDTGQLYNYFSIKLFGPLTFSYLFSIFLLLKIPNKKSSDVSKEFLMLRKIFRILAIFGVLFGVVGLIFSDYYFSSFIEYLVYIFVLLIHIEILYRSYSAELVKQFYSLALPVIIGSGIANIFNYYIGSIVSYGEIETTLTNSISTYIVLAILAINTSKHKSFILLFVFGYLFLTTLIGASGKFFVNLSLIAIIYFIDLLKHNGIKVYYIFGISVAIAFSTYFLTLSGSQLFNSKFSEFKSLSNVFDGDIQNISESPYIRVASILNIYKENSDNPFYFIFGRGYGGYFEDKLGYFRGLDLSNGAFSDENIAKNKYPSAHSTFAIVPLLHGFGGLCLICYVSLLYFKRSIKSNYLGASAILWLLFTFYFNILIGLAGIFFLFCSEYNLNNIYEVPNRVKASD